MLDVELKYKKLFDNSLNGLAYCQVVVDEKNKPIDYIFLEVNRAFEKMTHLKTNIIGKKVTDVIPGYRKSKYNLIDVYGNVALTGKEAQFEQYQESTDTWYSLFVYSPRKGFFVSISSDITQRKKAEEALKKLNSELEERVEERTKKLADYNVALRDSKQRYKELWNDAPVGYHVLNTEGIILNVNNTEAEMLGYERKEMIGHPIFDFIKVEQRIAAKKRFRLKVSGKLVTYDENRTYVKKDGSELYVSISDKVEKNAAGKVVRIRTAVLDITERRLSEEAIRQYVRALSMLSACNEALTYATREEELLEDICKIVVAKGGYKFAWVGSVEHDKGKSIVPIAQVGFEDGYLSKAHLSWSPKSLYGMGPTGKAVRLGKYMIGRYLSRDPKLNPWRKEALNRGFVSSIALPLKAKKKVFGVLMIYSSDPDAFNKKEIDLLLELSEDLAFGLMTIRLRKEHQEAEDVLRARNVLLKLSNSSTVKKEYLDAVLKLVKTITKCSHLGIRILKKSGHIPFDSFIGYSREFWETENFLSIHRDRCACIRVINGKPESQDKEAMTKEGSFFLQNSFKFLANLPKEKQRQFRRKCVRCGFGSLAIVPIRSKGKIIGAIHIADEKIAMLGRKKVEFLESLTPLIGDAIEKFDAAEKVQQSEEKYRELVENANSIIIRLDAYGNILFFNEFAEKFFGYKEADVMGRNIIGTIIPEEDSLGRNVAMMIRAMLRHPYRFVHTETECAAKDGRRVWVSWNNKPIFGKRKHLSGLLSIGNDITEKKRREEHLLESYNYLGLINRKISMLLDLDRLAHAVKKGNKKTLLEYILKLAMNIAGAHTSALYLHNGAGMFELLSAAGYTREHRDHIKILKTNGNDIFSHLRKGRTCIHGSPKEYPMLSLDPMKKMEYFILCSIRLNGQLKGALFLGFFEDKFFDNQEMRFFDIFSMHVAFALFNAGIINSIKSRKNLRP